MKKNGLFHPLEETLHFGSITWLAGSTVLGALPETQEDGGPQTRRAQARRPSSGISADLPDSRPTICPDHPHPHPGILGSIPGGGPRWTRKPQRPKGPSTLCQPRRRPPSPVPFPPPCRSRPPGASSSWASGLQQEPPAHSAAGATTSLPARGALYLTPPPFRPPPHPEAGSQVCPMQLCPTQNGELAWPQAACTAPRLLRGVPEAMAASRVQVPLRVLKAWSRPRVPKSEKQKSVKFKS